MIIWAVWQKLKCRLEISTDTPLVSLFGSWTQQPINFHIKHFRSSWGFCMAARMITCSRGKSRATTHVCDSRLWQFLVTAISNIKNNLIRAVRPVRTVWSVQPVRCSSCSVCSDCSGNVDCSDCWTCSGCSSIYENFTVRWTMPIGTRFHWILIESNNHSLKISDIWTVHSCLI